MPWVPQTPALPTDDLEDSLSGSEIRRLPRLLKAREAAEELHCSLPHIYALGRSGELPTARILRAVRFDAHAVITMQRGRLRTISEAMELSDLSEHLITTYLEILDAVIIDGRTYIPDTAIDLHVRRVRIAMESSGIVPAAVA